MSYSNITINFKSFKFVLKESLLLATSQVFNILMPIILGYFMIKSIGSSEYGLVVIGNIYANYLYIISSFGFDYIATSMLIKNRSIEKEIAKSIILIQLMISSIIFALMMLLVIYFLNFNEIIMYFILFSGVSFLSVLSPVWYFQYNNKLFEFAIINLISKTIFLIIGVFLILKYKEPVIMPIVILLSFLPVLFFSLLRFGDIIKIKIDFKIILSTLKTGADNLIPAISVKYQRNLIINIISSLLPVDVFGLYSFFEKIIYGIFSFYTSIVKIIIPYINGLKEKNKHIYFNTIKKFRFILYTFAFIGLLVSYPIVYLLSQYINSFTGNLYVQVLLFALLIRIILSCINLFEVFQCLEMRKFIISLFYVLSSMLMIFIHAYDLLDNNIIHYSILFVSIELLQLLILFRLIKNNTI